MSGVRRSADRHSPVRFRAAAALASSAGRTRARIISGSFAPPLLGYAHAVAGQEAEARHVLAELRERREQGEYIAPTEFAAVHIGLGERNEALDWLEHHEADGGARIFLKVDPIFAPLRTEPRFQLLLRRLQLE